MGKETQLFGYNTLRAIRIFRLDQGIGGEPENRVTKKTFDIQEQKDYNHLKAKNNKTYLHNHLTSILKQLTKSRLKPIIWVDIVRPNNIKRKARNMITTKENRATRFSIRATPKQKDLIARAATRSNKTISEFVLENAIEAAEALEMDNANFMVSRERYEQFLVALDEPPKSIPALRKLFLEGI